MSTYTYIYTAHQANGFVTEKSVFTNVSEQDVRAFIKRRLIANGIEKADAEEFSALPLNTYVTDHTEELIIDFHNGGCIRLVKEF